MHDVAVIGVGMMGAAALRYLAEAGVDVVGVGPAEPADRTAHTGVFASHYDEGRITRVLDPGPVWGRLGARAIAAYADIEARSEVRFHYPVGCLRVSDDTSDPGCTLRAVEAWGREHDVTFDALDAAALGERFPFLRFGDAAQLVQGARLLVAVVEVDFDLEGPLVVPLGLGPEALFLGDAAQVVQGASL